MTETEVATAAALFEATLLGRQDAGATILLEFAAAAGAGPLKAPAPGQFYQVRCDTGKEHLLRRPLSAFGASAGQGGLRLSFMVDVVGWGTRRLSLLEPGDSVGMLGPLGRGFEVAGVRKALLVAGGIGAAPLAYLARELDRSGVTYEFLAGFRTVSGVCPGLDELRGGVSVFTEDGSRGEAGVACDGLPEILRRGFDAAFVCGPQEMMAAAAGLCEGAGIPCQVSLDSRMACGIGACRGCVKEGAGGRSLCVCLEGPVFDSRQVSWKKRTEGSGPALR